MWIPPRGTIGYPVPGYAWEYLSPLAVYAQRVNEKMIMQCTSAAWRKAGEVYLRHRRKKKEEF
jgi:hypothetical protein